MLPNLETNASPVGVKNSRILLAEELDGERPLGVVYHRHHGQLGVRGRQIRVFCFKAAEAGVYLKS